MSPLQINLLLHVYAIAKPFDHPDKPIYQKEKNNFVARKLIKEDPESACGYSMLPRGYALIKMLLNTPLPELTTVFVDPRTKEVIKA